MDTKQLFNGISVIIDNQINSEETDITRIKEYIENASIPVVTYDYIPSTDVIPSFSNVSFVILDWDFKNSGVSGIRNGEIITSGSALSESQEEDLIIFIKSLLSTVFVPIFIFSLLHPDKIKEKLRENDLWDDNHPNRIFIKRKSEITSETTLFIEIEKWLKVMPSIYVLKEWEKTITSTKNKFFIDMYKYSPNWTSILWNLLKQDGNDYQQYFGDFLTRNLSNKIVTFNFDETIFTGEFEKNVDELLQVVEGERYIKYENAPQQVYTGDLFFEQNKYYLNIRAQCDLSRQDDPILYLIEGEELDDREIILEPIKLSKERGLVFSEEKSYTLEELASSCESNKKLKRINRLFTEYRNKQLFLHGDIIGKKTEAILTCVAGIKILRFKLELTTKNFSEIQHSRIGRVLPPYITRIQQSCMQHIFREGIMPTPKEIFSNYGDF